MYIIHHLLYIRSYISWTCASSKGGPPIKEAEGACSIGGHLYLLYRYMLFHVVCGSSFLAQPHNSPRSCRWTQPQLMQVVPSGLMLMKVVPSGLMQVASGWKPLAGEFMTSIWQVYGLIVQSIDHLSLIFKKAVVAKFSSILNTCSR